MNVICPVLEQQTTCVAGGLIMMMIFVITVLCFLWGK